MAFLLDRDLPLSTPSFILAQPSVVNWTLRFEDYILSTPGPRRRTHGTWKEDMLLTIYGAGRTPVVPSLLALRGQPSLWSSFNSLLFLSSFVVHHGLTNFSYRIYHCMAIPQ